MRTMIIHHKPTNINYEVILDNEDYEKVTSCGSWYLQFGNCKTPYVVNDKVGKLHRYILSIEDRNILIDHINRNTLDNRKSNLRKVNNSINKKI